jgi:hypothetical protein
VTVLGKIRRSLFGIPSEDTVFRRPGFAQDAFQRFQPVAHGLVAGYHATLEDSRFDVLMAHMETVDVELRGFAFEGVGMGLAALDCIAPWKNRVNAFAEGPGAPYLYPFYVGVGLALARLHRNPERYLAPLDPLFSWVIVDGYGFHEGFFYYRRTIVEQAVPKKLSAYGRQIFDQGLGRAIWFSSGANVERIARTIGAFHPQRQVELWSGIGCACAYAGGADRETVEAIYDRAAPYRLQLARGAAIAARGREQASNLASYTETACQVFCQTSSATAARIAEDARKDLPVDSSIPAYEHWRQRIQGHFAPQTPIRS